MPADQLDDVVSGMLRPFGFERPPDAPPAGSSPSQGSPINQTVGAPAPQVPPNQEPTVPFFSRSAHSKSPQQDKPVDEATKAGPTAPSSEQVSGVEGSRQGEDSLSMAAMVRDIMAISDVDPGSGSGSQSGSSRTSQDGARQASDDLMIGPAGKGFLKRSKPTAKGRSAKSQRQETEDPMAELSQDADQSRSRLRSH